MRRTTWILLATALLLPLSAWGQEGRFQVGQRVVQVSTGSAGTVTAVNPEKHQVQVRLDGRPVSEAGAWYFWGTPDLQPSASPTPAPPAKAPAKAFPQHMRPTPKETEPEEKGYEPMAPIGGPLSESVVKSVIEDNLNRPVDHKSARVTFVWNSVSISAPRRLGTFESDNEGIPVGTEAFPVRADFNYTVTSLKNPADATTTDRVGFAYFYLDAFRHWTFSWYAHAGTVNAVRRR